ncbi:MAG: transposase [Anaerococcus sp.]|nr:transposase [Anaerococcus sp.]
MTQLHFAISSEDIQNLIKESVDNKIARDVLTKLFNQLMKKERDEYLENKAYQEILIEVLTVMDTMIVPMQQK